MTAEHPTYVLYLGRPSAIAETIRSLLHRILVPAQEAKSAPPMELVTSQKLALRAIHTRPPLLLFVETTGKPESRLRFCQAVRMRLPSAPIVAVGTQSSNGYAFAFDAIVRTPVEPYQALAALRHVPILAQEPILQRGPVELNPLTRRVTSPLGEHVLTPKLCTLLQLLMEQSGRVVRRADIMLQVWETAYLEDTRTLDVHIRWLREMLEPDPASPIYLQTRRGQGYIFVTPEE